MSAPGGPILTLEPLIDSVRGAVEEAGWVLSGLQKTTSHEFAGRWEGESTRSAYLFFHRAASGEGVSIEAFLDETNRGVQGNVSLVLDGPPAGELGDAAAALAGTAGAARWLEPAPAVSLKLRLDHAGADPADAETELRIKVRIPRPALDAGAEAVDRLAARAVLGFERLLQEPELARYGARP